MLKKEFKRKDVNRVRNLVMGKGNASTTTQVGFNKKQKEEHCHYSGLPSVKSYNKIYESPDGGKTVYQREEGNYNNRVKIK